jgi:hypothetical protein
MPQTDTFNTVEFNQANERATISINKSWDLEAFREKKGSKGCREKSVCGEEIEKFRKVTVACSA